MASPPWKRYLVRRQNGVWILLRGWSLPLPFLAGHLWANYHYNNINSCNEGLHWSPRRFSLGRALNRKNWRVLLKYLVHSKKREQDVSLCNGIVHTRGQAVPAHGVRDWWQCLWPRNNAQLWIGTDETREDHPQDHSQESLHSPSYFSGGQSSLSAKVWGSTGIQPGISSSVKKTVSWLVLTSGDIAFIYLFLFLFLPPWICTSEHCIVLFSEKCSYLVKQISVIF